jgi:hypothetical protein
MSWITFNAALIAERMAGPELLAIKTAAIADDQDGDELVAAVAERVCSTVRGYIGACAKNSLGAEDTLPAELIDAALALAVHNIITRLPGMASMLDERRDANREEALALLRDVAACKFAIIAPETEAEEQPASGRIETLNAPRRQFTRDSMRGVL